MSNLDGSTALERHIIRQIRWYLSELAELRAERERTKTPPPDTLPPAAGVAVPLIPPPTSPAAPAAVAVEAREPHYMDAALNDAGFVAWLHRQNEAVRR